MSKLSLKVLFGVFALMFSASVGLTSECKDDPNECTPKNLCEVATQVINDNKVWSEDASAADHITFVKELGMECGVVEITDPCDLDPNECKVKQLCEKATIDDDGNKSWNADAEAYVELAKEYGLECGVKEMEAELRPDRIEDWSDYSICDYLKKYKFGINKHKAEAKSRGLNCGVGGPSKKYASWTDASICSYIINKNNEIAKSEAARRGLSCDTSNLEKIFANYFKSQSNYRRKAIQYALRELGYYKKSIDGVWGNGTRNAVQKFKDDEDLNSFGGPYVVSLLLEKVKIPSSFKTPKKSNSSSSSSVDNRNTGRKGWEPLSGNPKLSYDDAVSICEPKAMAEAKYFQRTGRTTSSGKYSCTSYGFNSIECSESSGGGFAAGILQGLEEAMSQRDAQNLYEATAKACMAEFGWILR